MRDRRFGLLFSMFGVVLCSGGLADETRFARPDRHAYRVRIEIVFGDDPLMSEQVRRRAIHDLRSRIRSVLGTTWDSEVLDDRLRVIPTLGHLRRLEAGTLMPDDPDDLDKVFVVAVTGSDPSDPLGRLRVGGVEFDVATGRLGAVATHATSRVNQLGSSLFAVVHKAFAPIAVVQRVEGDVVALQPVAAALARPGDDRPPLANSTLVPYLRYFDRAGNLVRVREIPSSYLRTGASNGTTVDASVVSAYRAPLGTRINRRVQALAIAVRRNRDETRVHLVRQGRTHADVAGATVEVVRKLRARDEAVGEPLELMSDRDGIVRVPRGEGNLFSWLYVKSGRAVIARVPLFAGVESEVEFEIPDDRPRLEVEGRIELLVADLVDTVARRETLLRRIRVLARDAKWEAVDELLPELDRIPTAGDFEDRLELLHTEPLKRVRADGNSRGEFAIVKMVSETRTRLRRFLDRGKIEQFKVDLEEERSLDATDDARLGLD